MADEQLTGIVKWFDEKKGFGFITIDDEQGDAFVHFSDIVGEGFRTLHEGERVKFSLVSNEKGPKAKNVVRLVDEETSQTSYVEETSPADYTTDEASYTPFT
jgi:CspA family cold shock protein